MAKIEPRAPEPRIGMITLGVHSLERAIDFYQQGLGWPRLEDSAPRIAFFSLKGTWLALYGWHELADDLMVNAGGEGFRGVTLAYMAKDPDEVDAVLLQARRAGGNLLKPGQKAFWGGYSGYFADPDGHLWEVAHNPFFWPGPGRSRRAIACRSLISVEVWADIQNAVFPTKTKVVCRERWRRAALGRRLLRPCQASSVPSITHNLSQGSRS